MSWLCTLGLATCITLAGNTLKDDDAWLAFSICTDSVNLGISQFGTERQTFLGVTGDFPGSGLHSYDMLIDLGFRQLKPKRRASPAERRLAFRSLCADISRDFRAH